MFVRARFAVLAFQRLVHQVAVVRARTGSKAPGGGGRARVRSRARRRRTAPRCRRRARSCSWPRPRPWCASRRPWRRSGRASAARPSGRRSRSWCRRYPTRWHRPRRSDGRRRQGSPPGRERMVSIGLTMAMSAEIRAPSPRTTMSGASMPRVSNRSLAALIKWWIRLISRALSTEVRPRLGPSSLLESSWLQVTGRPVISRIMSRAAVSCSGLRTANWAATA